MTAIGLKKRSISLGNQVESATDIGEKINNLSKQLNAVAGIALVAVSMSDEGLLSKGMILTSLLSSHEPAENLDALFEGLCWMSEELSGGGQSHNWGCDWPF